MEITPRMKSSAAVARQAAAEGIVLLKNEEHLLPLAAGTKVALFGVGQIHTIKGGTGSGEVNNLHSVNILEGLRASSLEVDKSLSIAYEAWAKAHPPVKQGLFAGAESRNYNDELPASQLDIPAIAARNDAALVVISRIAGEGEDMDAKKGTIYLTDEEDTLLKGVCAAFSKVVLILNTAGYMEVAPYLPLVQSLLFVGLPGQEGGHAIADILTGAAAVTGKLNDTWPVTYSDYPNCQEYSKFIPSGNVAPGGFSPEPVEQTLVPYHDDIYVGYRYFDTFGKEVLYPFGFGLSYGKPVITEVGVGLEKQTITVTAKVRNECTAFAAKQVVQVYVSAPDGKLEKPYQELKGYAKTCLMAPGESAQVSIEINAAELASYDPASASYILEPGIYYVRVGTSSRDTLVAGAVKIPKELTVKKLKNLMGELPEGFDLLRKAGAAPISYEGEEQEKKMAAKAALTLDSISFTKVKYSGEYVPAAAKAGVHFRDVAAGEATAAQLAASMELEDLAKFVCGQGMDFSGFEMPAPPEGAEAPKEESGDSDIFANLVSTLVNPNAHFEVAGEAGQSPDLREKYGIPPLVLCDGPAGVRITKDLKEDGKVVGHQYCTAFPTGSLLACSWNMDMIRAFGAAAGKEMNEFKVDLWLAPGMNIHRSPLCGRNFEYYSEDPVLTGDCAAAVTLGVQAQGGGVTIKHFAGNSQEFMRGNSNDLVSERALREIYLKGFQRCVEHSDPKAVMTSYNNINGVPSADNYDLCTAILRDEWGFTGLVMTDWGGGVSTPAISMEAGNDMIQPGGPAVVKGLLAAYEAQTPVTSHGMSKRTVTPKRAYLEKSAENILKVILRCRSAMERSL